MFPVRSSIPNKWKGVEISLSREESVDFILKQKKKILKNNPGSIKFI